MVTTSQFMVCAFHVWNALCSSNICVAVEIYFDSNLVRGVEFDVLTSTVISYGKYEYERKSVCLYNCLVNIYGMCTCGFYA
jgi:hypothetical protein